MIKVLCILFLLCMTCSCELVDKTPHKITLLSSTGESVRSWMVDPGSHYEEQHHGVRFYCEGKEVILRGNYVLEQVDKE